jgi:hypothetical protein
MAAKLTRLTHKTAAESCTICTSRSRRPVRKLLYTPFYFQMLCKFNRVTALFSICSVLSSQLCLWITRLKDVYSFECKFLVLCCFIISSYSFIRSSVREDWRHEVSEFCSLKLVIWLFKDAVSTTVIMSANISQRCAVYVSKFAQVRGIALWFVSESTVWMNSVTWHLSGSNMADVCGRGRETHSLRNWWWGVLCSAERRRHGTCRSGLIAIKKLSLKKNFQGNV